MVCNNFSIKKNQLNKPQKTLTNVYFDNVSKNSLKQDWQYEDTKRRRSSFAQEQSYNNAVAWQINCREKRQLIEIEKDSKRGLSIIFDTRNNYNKYLNQANKADKKM